MGVNELDYVRIGQRIRDARVAKGWPQSELAFRAGLNSAYVSHIETGKTKLALPTIVKIANALSVSVDELLCDSLEQAQLHSCEDPAVIAMDALKVGAAFYDADWCGVIEGDLEMDAWAPVLWYNVSSRAMTETQFRDLEETKNLERWVEALYACKPVIIPDTSVYKDSNPGEYALYERCRAKSILAVPFWKNPTGFMIVRNPKRYNVDPYESGFLQALAFVTFSAITEQKLINRTQKAFSPESIKDDKDIMVNLFGKLEIYTSKGVLTEAEISSPMICRFLVYMLLHGKHPVPARTIHEHIWPEEDIENAGKKIKSLAYRLQNVFAVISDYRLIISTPMGYQINPELDIVTDIQHFEEYWLQAQDAFTMQAKIELLKKAVELYRGHIYDCPDYNPTVFLSRNSTCCIRLAYLGHTFPLAHPNLQSSIFSEMPGNEKRAFTHPSKGAKKRSM